MSLNIIIIIIVFLKIYKFIIESIGMRENIVKNIFFFPRVNSHFRDSRISQQMVPDIVT